MAPVRIRLSLVMMAIYARQTSAIQPPDASPRQLTAMMAISARMMLVWADNARILRLFAQMATCAPMTPAIQFSVALSRPLIAMTAIFAPMICALTEFA
jgi:hypothetical protein